jgi:transposase-like protein
MIYTTNIIEGYHRQIRKITKSKGAFTSDNALLKLAYMAINHSSDENRRNMYDVRCMMYDELILHSIL